MTVTLFATAIFNNVPTDEKYIHPKVINGELEEGRFID